MAKRFEMGLRALDTARPTSAELARELLGPKRRESYGGDYSTVNSAQRVSATLSIRPRGRVQIIDM